MFIAMTTAQHLGGELMCWFDSLLKDLRNLPWVDRLSSHGTAKQ